MINSQDQMWVDSHCHLDFADFAEEGVVKIIDRARLNRVGHMLTISTHTKRIENYTAIADQFEDVWTTIGVHPHQANEEYERLVTAEKLVSLAKSHPKIVAIGECGLDFHYDFAPRDVQEAIFREHITAAIETDLPLVIHSRDADKDMMRILKDCGAGQNGLKAVMHCFSSTPELADFALKMGFFVSFSGMVTFPKSTELQTICKHIPLDRLLVETDAPYLAPVPYRGKRNEPAYVSHTGRFIVELHQQDEAMVMKQTSDNFFRLFNKIKENANV